MNGWVDFRSIRQSVQIQSVLDRYRIDGLRKKNGGVCGPCPIHRGTGARSFHVSLCRNIFNCFSCGASGNVLDLVAALEGCSIREAAIRLRDWSLERGDSAFTSQASTAQQAQAAGSKRTGLVNPPLNFQLRVDCSHAYGLNRGLTRDTLDYFGAGMCVSGGMFAGRFVIPLHNESGQLVGYAGRSLDDSQPKYLVPPSARGFLKSRLLFNLHRVVRDWPPDSAVVVVEGFFSTMKIVQAGLPCVSLMGCSLSSVQRELLSRHFKRVVLLFDGDEAGRLGASRAIEQLNSAINVLRIDIPQGEQPDDLGEKEILEILKPPLGL